MKERIYTSDPLKFCQLIKLLKIDKELKPWLYMIYSHQTIEMHRKLHEKSIHTDTSMTIDTEPLNLRFVSVLFKRHNKY